MSYDSVNYEDVEPAAPGMHFLRDALDAEQVGVTVLDADEGWSGLEHDHAEDGQEEVYVLVEGSATVTVEGEAVSMEAGDVLRIDPEATRSIDVEEESQFVLVGAP
ncbi:cupin [Salinarchaeum sp. Harcht-Bsk1]|uniref:cupin domain-containing protein n=1 Tax=Salinarchaeum sp. Harcht-Bsk1 TaxID=1333523 RepID=UPI0003423595|nr:cupin domain-containing protein [Salinarchaeum sp. Harcht-Bsk1]AGN01131.1 cupin [Salinarchaeum sp. Harcht-Bsk1]